MISESAVDLSKLPGRAMQGGYVYAITFDSGTLKVGSTVNPSQRIRTHQTSASQFAIAIRDVWVSPEVGNHVRLEKRLIAAALHMSTGVSLREWFCGVDFDAFVKIAKVVAARPNGGQSDAQAAAAPGVTSLWSRMKNALDVDTNAEAAAECGVPLQTLERMIAKPGSGLLCTVMKIRAVTGIDADEIVALIYRHHLSMAA